MTIDLNPPIFVGIDGGGTKCRVRLENVEGQLLGEGLGGTANPSHGLATVVNSIMTAVHMALTQANLPARCVSNLIVGAGLAGLHLPKYREVMANWQHPFKSLYLTDDLHVATIGAHAGSDGAVIIVGTGFSALSVVNNKKTNIGGHGFLQADHCSGSWIGYQGVQAVLLAADKLAEPTLLTQLLNEKFNAKGLELADKLVGASACEYGALAPLVFAASARRDVVALDIIYQSCDFINRVIRLLADTAPPRISMIGGVGERVIDQLDKAVVALLSAPIQTPEQGALHFARQQEQVFN